MIYSFLQRKTGGVYSNSRIYILIAYGLTGLHQKKESFLVEVLANLGIYSDAADSSSFDNVLYTMEG
jgi:hypothetical protein